MIYDKDESIIGGGYTMLSIGPDQGKGITIASAADSTFQLYSAMGTDGSNVNMVVGGPEGSAELWFDWNTGDVFFEDARFTKRGLQYVSSGYVTQPQSLTDKEYVDKNQLSSKSKTSLPPASPAGQMIYVNNATGGGVPAYSDGIKWRRVTDGTIID